LSIGCAVAKSLENIAVKEVIAGRIPIIINKARVLPDIRQIDALLRRDNNSSTAIDTINSSRCLPGEREVKPLTRSEPDLTNPDWSQAHNIERVRRSLIGELARRDISLILDS
jgi:hypothetical protein